MTNLHLMPPSPDVSYSRLVTMVTWGATVSSCGMHCTLVRVCTIKTERTDYLYALNGKKTKMRKCRSGPDAGWHQVAVISNTVILTEEGKKESQVLWILSQTGLWVCTCVLRFAFLCIPACVDHIWEFRGNLNDLKAQSRAQIAQALAEADSRALK